MRRQVLTYMLVAVGVMLIASVIRGWFSREYVVLWIGVVAGSLAPDLDSLVYTFYLKPKELSSQRIARAFAKKEYLKAFQLTFKAKSEREGLIFHTIFFQIVLIVFTYYFLVSVESKFGRGFLVAFLTHIGVDQLKEIKEGGRLDKWTTYLDISLSSKHAQIYVYVTLAILVFFALVV